MDKRLSFIILFLVSISAASALLIEPSSLPTSAVVGQEKTVSIKLTNDKNFSIYNIEFSGNPYITYPQIIGVLNPNESINRSIKILTNAAFSTTQYVSLVKFFYSTTVNLQPKTHNVTITDIEFIPTRIDITQGDTIRWYNNGSFQHTVTSATFNKVIPTGGTDSILFNDMGYIDYHDTNIGFHGYINVTNQSTQLIHNADFDTNLIINLESRFEETTLDLSIIDGQTMEVKHGEHGEGLLKVSNTGSKLAISILLQSNSSWIGFEENNFNLTNGNNNFVTFNINPFVSNVQDTNKTHPIKITLSSGNTGLKETIINVFVPYESELEDLTNQSYDQLIERIRELQEILKNIKLPASKDPQIIYKELEVPFNYTQTDIRNFKLELEEIKKAIGDTNKYTTDSGQSIVGTLDRMIVAVDSLVIIANESLVIGQENRQRTDNVVTSVTILAVIFVVVVGGTITTLWLKKYKKKSASVETMYGSRKK